MAEKNDWGSSSYDDYDDEQDEDSQETTDQKTNDDKTTDEQTIKDKVSDTLDRLAETQLDDTLDASHRNDISEDQQQSLSMYFTELHDNHPNLARKMTESIEEEKYSTTSLTQWLHSIGETEQPFDNFQTTRANMPDPEGAARVITQLITYSDSVKYESLIKDPYVEAERFNPQDETFDFDRLQSHAKNIAEVAEDGQKLVYENFTNITKSLIENDQEKYNSIINDMAANANRLTMAITSPGATMDQIDSTASRR